MENRIAELEKENAELKDLLAYYHGAERFLEKAETLYDSVVEMESNLADKALEVDDIAFNSDISLRNRERRIEEKEKEVKRLLAGAQKKSKAAESYIETKAKEKIYECRKKCVIILAGITTLYIITLIALLL